MALKAENESGDQGSRAGLEATAVILAAGKGTRMKSRLPKVLHTICGRPLLAMVIDSAFRAGARSCVVVCGHQAKQVQQDMSARYPSRVQDRSLLFALQSQQRGTGDAVAAAAQQLRVGPKNVLVLSGDVPLVQPESLRTLVAMREKSGAALTMASLQLDDPAGYGRLLRDSSSRILRIVEEKDADETQRALTEVNAGIYCFDRDFLLAALPALEPANAQGEYYLTDLVELASKKGLEVLSLNTSAQEAEGVNDRLQLARMESLLRRRINEEHMRQGVTLRDPASTFIDLGVHIESDVEIEAGVSLRGETRIGEGAKIGQGCVVINSTIRSEVTLLPYSHVEEAVISERARIGPFARLRPGTELAEEVHIGNFVETKKAKFGPRSKASHLSYLGDAVLGSDCNIGAGTITCNYDGSRKFETRLGDGVFVGSDSQLVAPVNLGDGSYVGAGSTVTKDVPPGALMVSRAPATIRADWASRKREREQKAQEKEAERHQPQESNPAEPLREAASAISGGKRSSK